MPTPDPTSPVMTQHKDVLLVVYPLVEMGEAGPAPTPTGSYACFMMRQESDTRLDANAVMHRVRNPAWITTRVPGDDGPWHRSAREAFEAGKAFADLEVYGIV